MGRLLESLPARIDIHCAKIAGRHIFWHAPFIAPLEQAQDVLNLAPGTFLYWPERQFLELIYGELQAESAQVSVLGKLVGDVSWLRELGEHVTRWQGHELVWAELTADPVSEPTAGTSLRLVDGGAAQRELDSRHILDERFSALRLARMAVWRSEPECIRALAGRRGIMLPFGPLSMAEGEFRKLQELLWRLGTPLASDIPVGERGRHAAFLIDAFLTRIVGLCGLDESGAVLQQAAGLLRDHPDMAPAVLEEVVLYCGRMAAWLDLYIPWSTLNDQVVSARNAMGGEQNACSLSGER